MKKKIVRISALCFLPVMLFAFLLAGCNKDKGNEDKKQTYTITVVGGTIQGGSDTGVFTQGQQCTIVADVPNDKCFKEWYKEGQGIVSYSNPYTFEVKGADDAGTYIAVLEDRQTAEAQEGDPVYVEKSVGGNPIGGFGVGDSSYDASWDTGDELWQIGERDFPTFAGDPSVLVANDPETGKETVYLYAGHDVSKTGSYNMPEWICYSSTDLLSWKAESIIMDIRDVPWANKAYDSAWAAQVIEYKGYYWFLFCSWSDNTKGSVTYGENGDQCIGVAISESPTGPFTCFSEPLVYSSWTNNADDATTGIPRWNDIDPTGLVTDANGDGTEEFYIAWGNSNCFLSQVEMVEVDADDTYRAEGYSVALEIVDRSATTDTKNPVVIDRAKEEPVYGGVTSHADSSDASAWDIMRLDCYSQNPAGNTFTEAPYLYERGGKYYMIYAAGWREALAYSVSDTIWDSTWDYGNLLMDATATSNTNHPAVFDFKGHTYMIYHNGSLPYGSGYRRVACIAELSFDGEGYIDYVVETSTGLTGVTSKITDHSGIPVSHLNYKNPQQDTDSTYLYPLEIDVVLWAEADLDDTDDMLWEIEEAKFVPEGEDSTYYVSIQSYNKAGLYLCYDIDTGEVIITQDSADPETDEALHDKKNMSFETLRGKDGGVMFRCVADSRFYLASVDGKLVVSLNATVEQRTFTIDTETGNRTGVYEANNGVVFA